MDYSRNKNPYKVDMFVYRVQLLKMSGFYPLGTGWEAVSANGSVSGSHTFYIGLIFNNTPKSVFSPPFQRTCMKKTPINV